MEYYLRCIDYPQYANPELLKLDYKTLESDKLKARKTVWSFITTSGSSLSCCWRAIR